MEISTLIGKEILTPAGEKLGYVKSAYLSRDRKKLSCLVCIDEDEEEFILPARAVLAAEDIIIASKARLGEATGVPCPIGSPAYSDKGELLGVVGGYVLTDADPEYVIVKDGVETRVAAKNVVHGDTLLVYPDGKKRRAVRTPSSKPRAPKQPVENRVKEPEKSENKPPMPENGADWEGASAIDRSNLLGKTVKISVYDGAGNPVALKGQRITPEIISLARRHNLLLRLTVSTLADLA